MGKSKRKNKKGPSQITKFLKEMQIVEQRRHVEQVIASYSGSSGTSSSSCVIQPDGRSTVAPKILTTEDGIPVNTLYAYFSQDGHLCKQKDVLRKMFEKYGRIKSIDIVSRPNSKPFAFISYTRCEDALSCLVNKQNFPHIYLKVADSWQQDAYKKQAIKEGTAPAPIEEGQILQLNDDCLRHIFEKLDLMDLIALKRTNRRFATVVRLVLKRYRSFDFAEPRDKPILTVLDTKIILESVGSYIGHLSLSGHRFAESKTTDAHRILGIVARNCFHLKELEISDIAMNPSIFKELEKIASSLEALALIDCNLEDDFGDLLGHCLDLQRLQLCDKQTTGSFLKTIVGLKSLNVENCSQLKGSEMFLFLKNNPQLESLNITECQELHLNTISAISHLDDLSHLACNDSYPNVVPPNMMLITRIPSITRLKLTISSAPSTERILQKFAKRNCLQYLELKGPLVDRISYGSILNMTELKELKIIGRACFGTFQDEHLEEFCRKTNIERLRIVRCPGLSEDKLIEFIERNPQLRLLEIPSVFLTEDFVYSVLDALHRNGSFLEVIVDREAWARLQEKVDDLQTLLKENVRLLRIKVGIDSADR